MYNDEAEHIMIYQNILDTIGNTPMIRIQRIVNKPGVEIYAKLEGLNPGGSIKDRIAVKMIEQAVAEGKLTRDKTIIEPTSGNTGIALAMIGTIMGYRVEIVMSRAVSEERRKMIAAFGAKLTLTDIDLGTDGAIIKARELVNDNPDKYFMPDQFSNHYNKLAHYENTAREIWADMDGRIDYFVSAIGTSGTIMGVGEALKNLDSKIRIVCAYPEKGHYIQGLKNMEEAIVPALYDKSRIEEFIVVGSEQAFAMSRRLAREEGIFAGMSSGAAMLSAVILTQKIDNGRVVVIFPDRGEKYISTDLFAPEIGERG